MFQTIQATEKAPDKKFGDQFRFRIYLPTAVLQANATFTDNGASFSTPATLEALRVEYRWGRARTTVGLDKDPDQVRTVEASFSTLLSANADLAALSAADEDPEKLKTIAATVPAGSVILQAWASGTNEIQRPCQQNQPSMGLARR